MAKESIHSFCVRVQVERANPMILRDILVPSDMNREELSAAACIALGLEEYKSRLLLGQKDVTKEKGDARGFLRQEEEARLQLFASETDRRNGKGVTLFLREEKDKTGDLPDRVPKVVLAVGRNLPREILDLGILNRIQSALDQGNVTCEARGTYYNEASLAFSTAKVSKAMQRCFSPETALPELHREYGMPMLSLLEKLKMNELKGMADAYGIYYDSTTRKPYLVSSFYRKYDAEFIKQFFEKMSAQEFLQFRRFVLGEWKDTKDSEWEDLMPQLFNRGLYTLVSKAGPRVAMELIDYYEEWYGTEEEKHFLERKYLRTALDASAAFYGIFDKTRFLAMLQILSEDMVSEDYADAFFEKHLKSTYGTNFSSPGPGLLCQRGLGTDHEMTALWEALPEKENFYHPSREEAMAAAAGESLMLEENKSELIRLFSEGSYGYRGWERLEQNLQGTENRLRMDGDLEKAEKYAVTCMDRYRWSPVSPETEKRLRNVLTKEQKRLPVMLLNGYSFSNAPKELKAGLEEWKRAALEKEQRKSTVKRTAAVKKRAVAKKK